MYTITTRNSIFKKIHQGNCFFLSISCPIFTCIMYTYFGQVKIWSFFMNLIQNGTVKCEEDTAWLRCNEYKHISIISAFWGRRNFGLCTEHTGNLQFNKYCPTTPLFLTKVKDACEGTTMCEIRCTKFFFNDQSCADVYKYLEVYYKCIEVINGHEVVNEDNLLNANFLGWTNERTNFL